MFYKSRIAVSLVLSAGLVLSSSAQSAYTWYKSSTGNNVYPSTYSTANVVLGGNTAYNSSTKLTIKGFTGTNGLVFQGSSNTISIGDQITLGSPGGSSNIGPTSYVVSSSSGRTTLSNQSLLFEYSQNTKIANNGASYFMGGNVGIGTSTPAYKLDVVGDIKVSGKIVMNNNWTIEAPDYVFNKDYKLPELDKVEAFIKTNSHLPEVPSAKEMKKNGVDVAQLNMALLKKVEELTLYVIEQNKKINELESKIK
jgi:hypothetical protein